MENTYDVNKIEMYRDAVDIQNASNPVAVAHTLGDMIAACMKGGCDTRRNPAMIAVFYKLYDMMAAPSEKEMYNLLLACEKIVKDRHVPDADEMPRVIHEALIKGR